jgi:2,5-diketo-D-gluconate reductase B
MYENDAAVGAAITASGVNRNELFVTTKVRHFAVEAEENG